MQAAVHQIPLFWKPDIGARPAELALLVRNHTATLKLGETREAAYQA